MRVKWRIRVGKALDARGREPEKADIAAVYLCFQDCRREGQQYDPGEEGHGHREDHVMGSSTDMSVHAAASHGVKLEKVNAAEANDRVTPLQIQSVVI